MTAPKRRDSARSRELLLTAATELFAERGFDRSTIREIGERAGVDPALIARYFGGKAQLYLATLQLDQSGANPADLLEPERARALLDHAARRGPGPILRAAVAPHEDPEVQAAAAEQLRRRLVDPLCERFTREGLDRPQLRAELTAAAFVGVSLSRSSGTFQALAEAGTEEIVALVLELLAPR
ncbi:TetR/AcrR family transcriptional regulator [Streptacidiphilus jiangxiensis]|uniref:DNA-binding transcriptional regulator, AcrR family n=1 Tax=Streptacidiphilus jiangxiensis TaxID=235985 RepID=A0A1H7TU33_STRJI|nr:TetR/AcrR family transcriptional regulator [Streptacidiphilus jiangxiensis]SEL88380.1 DNA-binding transcriptional regulator, AcrR family [Streptacidiphilus jiangxiensis]